MTAEPDDAELAAQALLESIAKLSKKTDVNNTAEPKKGTSEYYLRLAGRIHSAHNSERLRAMRLVAFVEQELQHTDLPVSGEGSLGILNAELLKHIDAINRDGGELKRRWQHCLAEVTVMMMKGGPAISDDTTDPTQ